MKKTFALITGSSQGIGRAYARELAQRGHHLLLVALPEAILDHTVTELKLGFNNIEINHLGIDLTKSDAPQKVYDWCIENGYIVDILVNNAGLAGTAVFDKSPLEYSDARILLNVRALTLLCQLFIPDLKKLAKAYILNTGSISGYYSVPYKSVYTATKAFVINFSFGIKEELYGTSVSISVVCPNGVYTNDATYERIKAHGLKGRLTAASAEQVAKVGIDGLFKGKTIIVPLFINRLLLILRKIMPFRLEQYILRKEFEKEGKLL